MAYLKGFEYDIFISYAHSDNLPQQGRRWVDNFCEELRNRLYQRFGRVGAIKMWRDPNLDGSQIFEQTLKKKIESSALFLALLSDGYLNSQYCRKELRWFCAHARNQSPALEVGERLRVLNVLLSNIPHQSWPEELSGATGFSFHNAKEDDQRGEPLDPTGKPFANQLSTLVQAIYNICCDFESLLSCSRDMLEQTADSPRLLPEETHRYCCRIVAEIEHYESVPARQGSSDTLMLSGLLFDDIPKHYVSPLLLDRTSDEGKEIPDGFAELARRLREDEHTISFVVGDSGIGKSSLLLRLLYEFSRSACNETGPVFVPLFVPLRELGHRAEGEEFFEFVRELAQSRYGLSMGRETLRESLASGEIILLLDGLDEVPGRDLVFLPQLLQVTRKAVVTARKHLISTVDDLVLHALSEESLRGYSELPVSMSLLEIKTFDRRQRGKYLQQRGQGGLVAKLESGDRWAIASSTIALRFIAEKPEILTASHTLTEIYEGYMSRVLIWYLAAKPRGSPVLRIEDVERFLTERAIDCHQRGRASFDSASPPIQAVPVERRELLLQVPLLSPAPAGVYGFQHPSWIGYLVARFFYRKLVLNELESLQSLMVDRSVSIFLREMVVRQDIPQIVTQIEEVARQGGGDTLLFNLSHVLQSYFLQRSFDGFDSKQDRADLATWLNRLESTGDIITEGYAIRIRAQREGPLRMVDHVERLRASAEFTARNVELFRRYNGGPDGFVSQMIGHLKNQHAYSYCLLLDLFMINALLAELRPGAISLLATPLASVRECHPTGEVRTRIDETLEAIASFQARDMVDPDQMMDYISDVTARAAAFARQHQTQAANAFDRVAGGQEDPEQRNADAHTEIERWIQEYIVVNLLAEYPHFDVIAEEETEQALAARNPGSPHTLIIDPIDFTRDYLEGGSRYAITVAVAELGRLLLAVAELPGRSERYLGRYSQGLRKVGPTTTTPITAAAKSPPVVVANREAARRLANHHGFQVRRMEFTLEDVLRCINGEISAVVLCKGKAHDVAPAVLFALEAGLVAIDRNGGELRFDRPSLTSELTLPREVIIARDSRVAAQLGAELGE